MRLTRGATAAYQSSVEVMRNGWLYCPDRFATRLTAPSAATAENEQPRRSWGRTRP